MTTIKEDINVFAEGPLGLTGENKETKKKTNYSPLPLYLVLGYIPLRLTFSYNSDGKGI